eukprot:NODE_388_length_9508_cov_0.225954.p7 type:complete len:132 gc:universal NODE_388_length_9508_cov_0.225954:2910-2515(-)
MITLGPIKLSCNKCISGHRTSYCDHIDSVELWELKPKGRPKRGSPTDLQKYDFRGKIIYCYHQPKECCTFEIEALDKPSQCSNCQNCCGKKCCTDGIQCKNCVGRCGCGCGATDQECNDCATDLCPKYWVE